MEEINSRPIVAIKPDGQLAGYFSCAVDVYKVFNADWAVLRKALEDGSIYHGLKWMFETDFRHKWMAGESLRFDKPEDYERYVRVSKEEEEKKRRIANLEHTLERIGDMKTNRNKKKERRVTKQRVVIEVVFPEIGRRFNSIRQASVCIGVPVSTMYRYARLGKVMDRLKSRVVIVYEEDS